MSQTIELKQANDVKRLIQAAFPNYRKTKCFLSVFDPEYGQRINSYWSGGSRDEYVVIELSTFHRHPLPTQSHPYFDIARHGLANLENAHVTVDHVGNITLKHLPEGFALIQAGTFCGKPATARVFVNAANLKTLLS